MYTTYNIVLFDATKNTTITVSEDEDGLGLVNVKADTKYFGDINFSMDIDSARSLANALLKQATFIEESGK